MIFKRLSKEDLDTISIVRFKPTPDVIVGIKESFATGFSTKYKYEAIKESFNKYEYYGIVDDNKYSVIGITFMDKSTEPDYIKKAIKGSRFMVISNLVSRKKGRGGLLVEYVINKHSLMPVFLTARHKSLITYYEKFGFKSILTDKQNHYPMVKQ